MVEPSARFEAIKIPLSEPVHDLTELSGVLGIPEWWPTGSRVALAIAHGSASDLNDPVIEHLHRELTERKYLTLRFNFPFAEAGKRSASDSMAVLERSYRSALAMLGRDPTAAPAHLFLGGVGLGAKVAARLATSRLRLEGIFMLGYPLHPQDRPESIQPEHLYRIISPMLFVQGTRDRRCDLDALRPVLARIGAPTLLHLLRDADQSFRVPKRSGRTDDEVRADTVEAVSGWVDKVLNEG